jgi:hypothetical protein
VNDTGAGNFIYYFIGTATEYITRSHIPEIYCIMPEDNPEELSHFLVGSGFIDSFGRHTQENIIPVQAFSGPFAM